MDLLTLLNNYEIYSYNFKSYVKRTLAILIKLYNYEKKKTLMFVSFKNYQSIHL